MVQQQGNLQLQPGMDNRMRLLLQQRQAEGPGAGMDNTTAQSPLLAQQLAGRANQGPGGSQGGMPGQHPASEGAGDLLDGDIDANLGMNDDDLLGDFGDDFNILEFADALDGNDTKTNILDDLEAEESKEGEKDDAKPPPYPPPQGPPPPYPGPHKEQPLLIQDLLDQEKREQQQQQPNVMGAQQQPPQPQQQQRHFIPQGQQGPALVGGPGGPGVPGGAGGIRPPGQVWRHPQEVTLQQRGPQMAVQAEGEARPAPPPVVNIPAPPAPPDNPQTEEERRQVARYEQWLAQQETAINEQLNYYEKEITKLRKQRKSLNSKQRTLRKNGNELSANDAADLERVSSECLGLQKSLESIRKQSRQHNMLKTDHLQKKQKALEGQPGVRPPGPGVGPVA